jgi:hypothetical protein
MFDASQLVELQIKLVDRWHRQAVDNPYQGQELLERVCQQHAFNFRLWHEEDIARSPDVSDSKIAEVKRNIDRLNQQRNDAIEQIDDWLSARLQERGIAPASDAPQNSETPGSCVDRLSIMAIRMYHLSEQAQRKDASLEHRQKAQGRLLVCGMQQRDLQTALQRLADAIAAGQMRHRTYRQFKMYNDPSMNPYLYQAAGGRKAA